MDICKKIENLVEDLEGDERCKICLFNGDCVGGVKCYGGTPSYPPCADSDFIEHCLDEEAAEIYIKEMMEDEEK